MNVSSSTSPIASAVEPLRASAVERARIEGRKVAQAYLDMFAADPTLAQYPKTGFMSKAQYNLTMTRYRIVQSLTSAPSTYDRNLPRPLPTPDPVKLEKFVDDCGERAEKEYTAFVAKLEKKIGTCDTAELQGDHVWGYSVLRVTKGDVVELWKTHQIVNVSILGKCFNQWPTRKVKNACL